MGFDSHKKWALSYLKSWAVWVWAELDNDSFTTALARDESAQSADPEAGESWGERRAQDGGGFLVGELQQRGARWHGEDRVHSKEGRCFIAQDYRLVRIIRLSRQKNKRNRIRFQLDCLWEELFNLVALVGEARTDLQLNFCFDLRLYGVIWVHGWGEKVK